MGRSAGVEPAWRGPHPRVLPLNDDRHVSKPPSEFTRRLRAGAPDGSRTRSFRSTDGCARWYTSRTHRRAAVGHVPGHRIGEVGRGGIEPPARLATPQSYRPVGHHARTTPGATCGPIATVGVEPTTPRVSGGCSAAEPGRLVGLSGRTRTSAPWSQARCAPAAPHSESGDLPLLRSAAMCQTPHRWRTHRRPDASPDRARHAPMAGGRDDRPPDLLGSCVRVPTRGRFEGQESNPHQRVQSPLPYR